MKITAVLAGAGQRGAGAYGPYALEYPDELQFVGVADPDIGRREEFRIAHKIDECHCYNTWEELLDGPQKADAILICTQDKMHYQPTIKALEKGYHVLLEKPMSNSVEECVLLGEYAKKYNRVFSICHVLRYTSFFSTLKKLLDDKRIGDLVSIQHNENVAHWHHAHSYVRGNWRNQKESSPMLLSKSCHDMDILLWLAGADCTKISSFGSLLHFTKENAPHGAPARCMDGCLMKGECPYYAPKLYMQGALKGFRQMISLDTSDEAIYKALKEGPYGRCVYYCDNDVVDHQVVNMEFRNGATAVFTMCAFTYKCSRTLKLMGTKGEIRCDTSKNEIELTEFLNGRKEVISLNAAGEGHMGGDLRIMRDFVRLIRDEVREGGLTAASRSVQSHLMAFAAEKSRLENVVVDIPKYADELTQRIVLPQIPEHSH